MFFGEPNRQLSNKTELRFGTNGSKSVKLETGQWYDHELGQGGGVLDLIRREVRVQTDAECFAWLESKFLWSNGRARSNGKEHAASAPKKVVVDRYEYEDASGALIFVVERVEYQNRDGSFVISETGKRKKTFWQKRPDPDRAGGWLYNVDGVPAIPYKLADLVEAAAAEHPVLIVEGERKVNLLRSWGVAATCCSGGANKWRPEHAEYLRGAAVVILPDNDDPGRAHVGAVAATLQDVAASVSVLELPGLGAKEDIRDWAAKGGTVEQLHQLIEHEAKPWVPTRDPGDGNAFGYSWRWIWHGEIEPLDTRKYLVEGLLPETGTALISGQWGTYKTFVADDLAASVMTGSPFINSPVLRKGGVLWFAAEGQNEVPIRITAAWKAKGGTGRAPFAWERKCPRLLDANASKILAAMVKQAAEKMMQDFGLPVVLVIIDTAGKAAGLRKDGQLNDDAAAKIIMKTLDDASHETGALFVGVAHFGKNVETGTKGSTGFEDDADVILALLGERSINGIVEDPRLCVRKRKWGSNGEEFPFRTKEAEMGANANGYRETTLTLLWPDAAEVEGMAKPKKKDDPWTAKSLRLLRQVLMNMLADCGQDMRPYPDGPVVRAVDQEIVRAEFYKSYPAEGDAEAKKAARQRAFRRAVLDAQAKWLIGVRDVGAITYVWLATPTTPQTSRTSARSNSSGSPGAHASPTCSSYEILGPASAGERCALCGKAGALRIKHGGGVDLWHEGCAKQYFAAMDDPPVKVPDPGPVDEHGAPMDTD